MHAMFWARAGKEAAKHSVDKRSAINATIRQCHNNRLESVRK